MKRLIIQKVILQMFFDLYLIFQPLQPFQLYKKSSKLIRYNSFIHSYDVGNGWKVVGNGWKCSQIFDF